MGRQRVPVHCLLSAGIVVRSQVCNDAGTRFMTYAEACCVIPDLRKGDSRTRAAWEQLRIDLLRLGIEPRRREPTFSARQLWHATLPSGVRCPEDGTGHIDWASPDPASVALSGTGSYRRTPLDADDWLRVYQKFVPLRLPRAAAERDLPLPTDAELRGPHTIYVMPHGARRSQGRPLPLASSTEQARLLSYVSQRWRISDDGMHFACAKGTLLADASAVVRLFATALPRVHAAHEAALKTKAAKLAKATAAAHRRGDTPPDPAALSKEELTYRGGPGFCIDLANEQLRAMLSFEQGSGHPSDRCRGG